MDAVARDTPGVVALQMSVQVVIDAASPGT